MKQFLLVIAALVTISVAAQAQYDSNQVRKVGSLPATCTAGTTNLVVYQGATYQCTATNTWTKTAGLLPTSTYAGLPTCAAGNDGQLVRVTDANRDVYSCYGTSGKWVSRNGGVYNVRDFGAVGDGSTDDTTAIQTAITAAAAGTFGNVVVPGSATAYKITSSLTIPAYVQISGTGNRASVLTYNGTSYAIVAGSTSSGSLSYGIAVRNLGIVLTANAGNAIHLAGTAYAEVDNVYLEGVVSTSTGIAVYVDGANAANIGSTLKAITANHFKKGYVWNTDGSNHTTSVLMLNCTAYGDSIASSTGIAGGANDTDGCRVIGGNFEAYANAIYSLGKAAYFAGVRFESNTQDVYFDTGSSGNIVTGCMGIVTTSNGGTNNQFLLNVNASSPRGIFASSLANLTLSTTTISDNLTFTKPGSGATRYMIFNDTSDGKFVWQAGTGSGTLGGAVNLFGSSHATRPGWVTIGLGGSSARKFTINDSGLAGGTDVFTVDQTGATTLSASLSLKNATATASAGATLSLDLSTGNIRTVTFGAGNITSLTATNIPVGPVWVTFIQDSTGSRVITAWDALFLFAGGTKPTLSVAASARDMLHFLCDGTNCVLQSAIYDVR